MNSADDIPPSFASLDEAPHAPVCLEIAMQAEAAGDTSLFVAALNRAIRLDRDCLPAILTLATLALEDGDHPTTLALLEEAARVQSLPAEVEDLRAQLLSEIDATAEGHLPDYLRMIGRIPGPEAEHSRRIVLATNIFPPQELGGYGRMMWEFVHGLRQRGHIVKVLTADLPELAKTPTDDELEMESCVLRTLELVGTWSEGRAQVITDQSEIVRRLRDNAARLSTAVRKHQADLVILGNMDFLGASFLRPALDREIPVIHAVANVAPGYLPSEQPFEAHYWIAPCSDWNGRAIRDAGYTPARLETIYPGARVDRFFRLHLPDLSQLRICFASLVMPYKGAHTLVSALFGLNELGVPFTAEIAGDSPDPVFYAHLQQRIADAGLSDRVKFPGFLDRRALSALFARSNVLAFPSEFEEPFGISQVEAMAAGLVVVSSGTGGAKEIVRPEVDGLLFPAGDAAGLAGAFARLSADPALFSRLQSAAQPRAIEFAVNHSVRKFEALADELQGEIEAARLPLELDTELSTLV